MTSSKSPEETTSGASKVATSATARFGVIRKYVFQVKSCSRKNLRLGSGRSMDSRTARSQASSEHDTNSSRAWDSFCAAMLRVSTATGMTETLAGGAGHGNEN